MVRGISMGFERSGLSLEVLLVGAPAVGWEGI